MGCTLEHIGIDIVADKLVGTGKPMGLIDTAGYSFVGRLVHTGRIVPKKEGVTFSKNLRV